jgi:GntR family histidine utilization transcriptional repressor
MSVTYRDIKADILAQITSGVLAPGGAMPNEVDLATGYGCARATVNRAMRELAEEGIIERKRKAGSRVRMAPVRAARFEIPIVRQEIEEGGAAYRYALVNRAVMAAPDWLRARLALGEGAQVLHLICMHYADGTPYQHEDRWINLAVNPDAEKTDFTKTGPNEWLVAAMPFSNAQISFQAVQADAGLAEYLGCVAGDALFQTERSTWWEGTAVTFVRLTYRRGHRMTAQY